jgi:hypothetical protein
LGELMFAIFGSNIGDRLAMAAVVVCIGASGIAIMTCAFYGWGRLTRRLTGLSTGTWPVTTALGLASVLFLGGLLNLCRLAYPATLAGVVVAGLMLSALAARHKSTGWRMLKGSRNWCYAASWGTTTIGLMGFTIVTQLAPSLYNADDDFQHYFPHAVRMVETGTLYGSPLNALGGIGLGGQAFLQGFIVGYFPIRFINAADAVFCFFLCLVLAGGVAIARPAIGLAALCGTLMVFFIDPQYVNVSSLFSTAAMVSALMIVSVDPREGGDGTSPRWRQAAAPALFYAGTVALKPTGVIFLSLQFGIAATASCLIIRDWRTGLTNAGWIATWSLVFISPWLLLYAPYYLIAVTHPLGLPLTQVPEVQVAVHPSALFSPDTTFRGSSRLAYTCLVAGLFLCTLYAIMKTCGQSSSRKSHVALASASAAAGGSYLFWVLIAPHLDESTSMFRYSIPVLIGVSSAALPLCATISARGGTTVSIIVGALVALLFVSSTGERVTRLLHHGAALAYLHIWSTASIDQARHFMRPVLNGDRTAEVRQFQEMIPPGKTLLAWTTLTFLLDYRRNRIVDVNEEGLGKPWARIPQFHYILWQYKGYAAKNVERLTRETAVGRHTGALGARGLDVLFWLDEVVQTSENLMDHDGMILARTNERALPPPN